MSQHAIDSNPRPNPLDTLAPVEVSPRASALIPPPVSIRSRPSHHDHPGTLHALQSLMYIIVIAIFIITFCVQPFRIPSASMEPSLLVGDFLLVNKQSSTPGASSWLLPSAHIRRGNIVVFHYPIDPSMHLVKRVIGVPGDRIKLRNGRVFVNGQPLTEPYAMYLPGPPDSYRDNFPRLQSTGPDVDSRWWIRMHTLIENGELIVPSGNYFVLGDNRNDSEDSRYWGFVPRDAIVGQPFLIYFSLQQHGTADEMALSRPPNQVFLPRHPATALDAIANFARWDRTLQIVK